MAEKTEISWADATANPWLGCQKVSPACDFCYAQTFVEGRLGHMGVEWGPGQPRHRTAAALQNLRRWNKHPERLNPPPGTKPFIFGGSLCDVFDNAVDPVWRREYFDGIRAAPNLAVLLLTKRPQLILRMVEEAGGLPPNVALGTTVEDLQRRRNLDFLLQAGARLADKGTAALFLFGSFEPLLERISIRPYLRPHAEPGLDWVIVGGESGSHAREMPEGAAEQIQEETLESGAIFHFKQRGGRGRDKGGHQLAGKTYHERPLVAA